MKKLPFPNRAGFTLAELMVYAVLVGVVSLVAFQALRAGSSLSVKNLSINQSHQSLRSALDRLSDNLRAARNVPTLLTDTGATTSAAVAAGIRYDRTLGEPYVLHPPTGAGSIAATDTRVSVWRSTDPIGLPPIPEPNDVLLIDTPTGAIRGRVKSVDVVTGGGGTSQKIMLTFTGPVGKSLSWSAHQPQWARLVREESFVVVPENGKNELRFYPSFQSTSDLDDPSSYVLVTDQLGTAPGDATPFSILDSNGDKSVQVDFGVRVVDHNRWLTGKQAGDFNTVFHMDLNLTPRLRPRTSN
jgi:type II secretory pathway pseudopilin PulG